LTAGNLLGIGRRVFPFLQRLCLLCLAPGGHTCLLGVDNRHYPWRWRVCLCLALAAAPLLAVANQSLALVSEPMIVDSHAWRWRPYLCLTLTAACVLGVGGRTDP
jgi:hypothetical protein